MGLQPGCWVQLHVGQVDVSMENCSMKTGAFCPKCGQKGFFFFCSFLNLSRLCWEQVLWQKSSFLIMMPQLSYLKVSRGNA